MSPRFQFHQHVTTPALLSAMMVFGYDHSTSRAHAGFSAVLAHHDDDAYRSADARRAADFVQAQINQHWMKTSAGWTTKFQRKNAVGDILPGEPDLLYRQLRELDFTLEPRTATHDMKADGVQYVAVIDFTKTSERAYRRVDMEEGPKGWSAWQDASLGAFATIEKRNGKWSIHGTDLFNGVKPNGSNIPPG